MPSSCWVLAGEPAMDTRQEGLMRVRAFGVFAAMLLLAGGAGSAVAAEQGMDGSPARLAGESTHVATLLSTDQLVAGGSGQWIWPGVAGGSYGGFATPQTAAFFGYGNSFNPLYQAGVQGSLGNLSSNQVFGLNTLSGLNQTGLAPGTALTLGSLAGLGVASSVTGPGGANVFGIGGVNSVLLPGQTLANTSLGNLPYYPGYFQSGLGFAGLNPFLAQLGVGLNFVR
jgi:hypothetical protein